MIHTSTRPRQASTHAPAPTTQQVAGATPAPVSLRFVRGLLVIWLGYVLTLLLLDTISVSLRPDVHPLPGIYYIVHSLPPLILILISLFLHISERGVQQLLKVTMAAMAVLPLLLTPLLIPVPRPGPLAPVSGILATRMLPVVTIDLILIVWRYQWRHVVIFSLVTGCISATASIITANSSGIVVALIHTLTCLSTGYCMCLVVGRIRAQGQALVLINQELEQANRDLLHYASTLERLTVSRERNRMARELHDTLAHTLTALTVQMETAKLYTAIDPNTTRELLDTALDAARQGLTDTRRALKALRASPLEDLGLKLGLTELVSQAALAANLQLTLNLPDELPVLPPSIEQCVYRIVQEAVTNVGLHAGGSSLLVQVTYEHHLLSVLIKDDGRGFNPHAESEVGHFGLAGMRERAQLAGGQLTLESQPGHGTIIRFKIGV